MGTGASRLALSCTVDMPFWRLWGSASVACNPTSVACNLASVACNLASVACNLTSVACNQASAACNQISVACNPSARTSRYNSSPLKSGLSPDAAPGVFTYQDPRTEDGGRGGAVTEPVQGTRREHPAPLVVVKTLVRAEQSQGALQWPIYMRRVSARCTPAMALGEVSWSRYMLACDIALHTYSRCKKEGVAVYEPLTATAVHSGIFLQDFQETSAWASSTQ